MYYVLKNKSTYHFKSIILLVRRKTKREYVMRKEEECIQVSFFHSLKEELRQGISFFLNFKLSTNKNNS